MRWCGCTFKGCTLPSKAAPYLQRLHLTFKGYTFEIAMPSNAFCRPGRCISASCAWALSCRVLVSTGVMVSRSSIQADDPLTHFLQKDQLCKDQCNTAVAQFTRSGTHNCPRIGFCGFFDIRMSSYPSSLGQRLFRLDGKLKYSHIVVRMLPGFSDFFGFAGGNRG